MSRWIKTICLIVAVAIVFTGTVTAQDEIIEVVGGDEAALRELLVRIVTPMYSGAITTVHAGQITVGMLPDNLPFELPLPKDADILGGMTNYGPTGTGQIYLNVVASVSDIAGFYTEAFEGDSAWHPAPSQPGASGFVAAQPQSLAYCSQDDETLLLIWMTEVEGEATPVNIFWQDAYTGACGPTLNSPTGLSAVIPALALPQGVQMRGGSSGGSSSDSSYIAATLSTDLTAEALAEHYAGQLTGEGWEMASESNSDVSAVSTWTMQDNGDNWLGVLLVVDGGENERTSLFHVTRSN